MKPLFFFISLYFGLVGFGQDYEVPDFYINEKSVYWKDTITANQKAYWKNGIIRVQYEDIGNGKKLRKEFDQNGDLKYTFELYQKFDTTEIDVYDDFGEIIDSIFEIGFHDVFDGKFVKYKREKGYKNNIAKQGQFKDNYRFGTWVCYDLFKYKKVILTFNHNGLLEGEFKIYYIHAYQNTEHLEIAGEYKMITLPYYNTYFSSKYSKPRLESKRNGEWLYYNPQGDLIDRVIYQPQEWKQENK